VIIGSTEELGIAFKNYDTLYENVPGFLLTVQK